MAIKMKDNEMIIEPGARLKVPVKDLATFTVTKNGNGAPLIIASMKRLKDSHNEM